MAEQNIYTGATGNDGTGDKLRVAFNKVNHNFNELYDVDRNTANSIGILSNNTSNLANSVNQLGVEHDVSSNVANAAFAVTNVSFNTANAAFGGANTAVGYANQAGVIANAAFGISNVSYNATNSSFGVINAAFAQSNTDSIRLSSAYVTTNAAFGGANTAVGYANQAGVIANAAFAAANNTVTDLSPAFNKANDAFDLAVSAYDYANTITSGNTDLSGVYSVANAAFDAANNIVVPDISPVFDVANAAFDAANNANTNELTSNGFTVSLNTAGYVTFGQTYYNQPDTTNREGEKLVLWDQPGYYSYSMGIEEDAMWFGVDEGLPTKGFTWYTGNTKLLQVTREGNVAFSANGHIYNRPNSSGDGLGYDTLEIYPDGRYTNGLVIDRSATNHIHLRGTGEQDNSITDLFVGGENSHFKISAGLNPEPVITSNGSSWSFYDDGSLEFPDSTIQYTAYSNLVFDVANAAFGAANNIVVPDISDVYDTANAAFDAANNIVVPDIVPAFNKANDSYDLAGAAYNKANNFLVTLPSTSKGTLGDVSGMFAANDTFLYYCTTTYVNGVPDIWKRVSWSNDVW